jgi:glycosyltransferase involved in cell wall biosynthesis
MNRAMICFGGNVNLGRRMHFRARELGFEHCLDVPSLQHADLSIVNLVSVVSTLGEPVEKAGESGPFYFRARPEMLDLLAIAGVDAVGVANKSAGDYGAVALLDQQRWLAMRRIAFAGSGANMVEALRPVYLSANGLKVAFMAIDTTRPASTATQNGPGIAFVDINNPGPGADLLEATIREARDRADVVLVAAHWGDNEGDIPSRQKIDFGRHLIDLGADAVLGTAAHRLQGIDLHKGRPIIHDAGSLLFDSLLGDSRGGVFNLAVDRDGVAAVTFVPVKVSFGHSSEMQGSDAAEVSRTYRDLCNELGTELDVDENGHARLTIREGADATASRQHVLKRLINDDTATFQAALEVEREAHRYTVNDVPADCRLVQPLDVGPLTLLGIRIRPKKLSGRGMLWIDSYWTCDAPVQQDWRIDFRPGSKDAGRPLIWGGSMDHDPCDWMVPTSSWVPGTIYCDNFGLRPPSARDIRSVRLELDVRLVRQGARTPFITVPDRAVPVFLPQQEAKVDRPPFARPAIKSEQRPTVTSDRCKVSFLNIDIHWHRTGIEVASLLRARLFEQELGIVPDILAARYNPQQHDVVAFLRKTGKLSDHVEVWNLYDFFQEAGSFDPLLHRSVDLLKSGLEGTFEWREVVDRCDHEVFNDAGKRVMYVARDLTTGEVIHVNHFEDDIKWRRDVYDCRGFLSCIQFIEPDQGQVSREDYLRPSGEVALRKTNRFHDGKSVVDHIETLARDGSVQRLFQSEMELVEAWLQHRVDQDELRHILFVDKNLALYEPAINLRDKQSDLARIFVFPVIHAMHTTDHRCPGTGRINRHYKNLLADVKRPDAMITLTDGQKEDIIDRFGDAVIYTIGHAYNNETKAVDFETRERLKVVYLARYSPEKNHLMAIRAFRSVVDTLPEATLHCYGFGAMRSEMASLISELDLNQNVFIHGWAQETAAIYEGAGMAIMASQSEAYSLAVMESLSHGCPVVSFDIQYGPKEMIEHGVNGFLSPFGDVAAFAQYIIALLLDEPLHRQMSNNARRTARRFSVHNNALEWRRLMEEAGGLQLS